MKTFIILLIIILSIIVIYFSYCLIIVFIMLNKLFGSRCYDPSNPCYLRFEDYEDELSREEYTAYYYAKEINGYIYKYKGTETYKGFVVLSHGMFGTHVQYLLDIYMLAKDGYIVLAYDQFGCGLSEGKKQESLATGIYVLENVLYDIKKRNINNNLPISLYGHSWGAYCVVGASKSFPNIKKIIARSGPISLQSAGKDMLKQQNKFVYYSILPLFSFSCFVILSRRYSIKATRGPKKNNSSKYLLIHAKNDTMVNYKHSLALYYLSHPQSNIEVFTTKHGQHNSLLEEEGGRNYKRLVEEYERINAIEDLKEKEETMNKFLLSLNRREQYPYNQEVKDKILSFLDND